MRNYKIINNYKEKGYDSFRNVNFYQDEENTIYKVYDLDEYDVLVSIDFTIWYK